MLFQGKSLCHFRYEHTSRLIGQTLSLRNSSGFLAVTSCNLSSERSQMQKNEKGGTSYSRRHIIGFCLGIAFFVLMLALPAPCGMSPRAKRTAAVTLLMVCWWISEALPIPATALVPLALYPILKIMDSKGIAKSYGHEYIFLFMGGFCIAIAMQRWNLHRRIALHIIKAIGDRPRRLVLGFMVATAFLSMWISNTATTMMMLPIGIAMIAHLGRGDSGQLGRSNFGTSLMLGIAYSASIGGIGTLIGTPPNIVFAGHIRDRCPGIAEVGFLQWMLVGVPLVIVFLPLTWWYLTYLVFPPEKKGIGEGGAVIDHEIASLGRMSRGEKCTLLVFVLTCLAWIFRKEIAIGSVTIPGWTNLLGIEEFVHDSTIAVAAALLLFMMPVDLKKREFVLDWESAVKLPWGILILFGGGFALANGFEASGLANWIGSSVTGLAGLPIILIIAVICLLITFLTETTSNTATTAMILPVLAGMSIPLGVHPLVLMLPATLSASCAFMLPVATPPNAIVFSSGQITIPTMAKTGIVLNLCGVVLVTAVMYLVAVPVFDIVFPGG